MSEVREKSSPRGGTTVARGRRMDRRGFCVNACQIASLFAFGSLLEGCGGSPTSPSDNVPQLATISGSIVNGAVTVNVAAGSPLAAVGGAALVQSGGSSFLVVRTAQDTFNAMTSICTHEQCTITGFSSQTFTCPCHGSQYSTTGAVIKGPATRSLQRFTTAIAANILTITT
jgi:cytochrome b6-f complex iron-sulfur subunit